MRRLSSWIVFLCFCFFSLFAASADNVLNESSRLLRKLEKDVFVSKLDNGVTVIIYRRGHAPVFSGSISVRVGGVDEQPGSTGISHMLEHMAFKGTKSIGSKDSERELQLLDRLEDLVAKEKQVSELSKEELALRQKLEKQLKEIADDNALDRIYREIGSEDLNATTGSETTDYFVSMPRSAFELWCKLEADRLVNPVMRQFYPERDVVLEERRMRFEDSPGGKIYEAVLGAAFKVHPYGKPVIGYESDLRGLTARMTADFHRQFYHGGNITVAIVGDVDPDRDLDLIEDYFGQVPAGVTIPRSIPAEPEQTEERVVSLNLPSNPQLVLAYKKPNYPHPDDAPLTVLGELLAGSRTSVLYKNLVQKEQTLSGIDYFEAPATGFPNLLIFQAVPRFGVSNQQAKERIEQELSNFLASIVSEAELTKVKRGLSRSYIEELDSNIGLARSLATTQTVYNDWTAHIRWFDEMVKVSPEDVQRVGRQYLKPERRTTAFLETQRPQ